MRRCISLAVLSFLFAAMAPSPVEGACIIRHVFTSAKADSSDATLIRPSNWNDCLKYDGGINGQFVVVDTSDATYRTGFTAELVFLSNVLRSVTTNTVDLGSSSVKFKDLWTAGDANIGDQLVVSGAGPHAIGGTTTATHRLRMLGTFSPDASGGSAFNLTGTINAPVAGVTYGAHINPTLVEAASGTHGTLAGFSVDATFTDGAGATTNVFGTRFIAPSGTATPATAVTTYISGAPTLGTTNYALWVDDGATRLDGPLLVNSVGPHAVGSTSPSGNVVLSLFGTFTPADAASINSTIRINNTINLAVGATGGGLQSTPIFVEAASGIHPVVASIVAQAPTITDGGATTTAAASIYVQSAPTGGDSNYALFVDAGTTRLDGTLLTGAAVGGTDQVGAVYPGSVAFASLSGTATNGQLVYCSNCVIANPCAGAGTGAIAKRLNGVWVCN